MTNSEYIMSHWDELPISTFDELQVVIVKCINHSEEGWGHHSYAGYGCTQDGRWVYCYSSGCSCSGGPDYTYMERGSTQKALYMSEQETIDSLEAQPLLTPKEFSDLQVSFSTYG